MLLSKANPIDNNITRNTSGSRMTKWRSVWMCAVYRLCKPFTHFYILVGDLAFQIAISRNKHITILINDFSCDKVTNNWNITENKFIPKLKFIGNECEKKKKEEKKKIKWWNLCKRQINSYFLLKACKFG